MEHVATIKNKKVYIIDEDVPIVRNNILEIIKKKSIKLSDLSEITGVSKQRLNDIVKHKINPGLDAVLKICFCLDCKVEEIFELTENSWFTAYKDDDGDTLYLNSATDKIVTYSKMKTDDHFYYNKTLNKFYLKKEGQELLNQYVETNLNLITKLLQKEFKILKSPQGSTHIKDTDTLLEFYKELPENFTSIIQEIRRYIVKNKKAIDFKTIKSMLTMLLKKEFHKDYERLYKKLFEKQTAYQIK